jgi:hypothetical protein
MSGTSWNTRKNNWVAAQCGAFVALVCLGAHLLRAGLDRISSGNWGQGLALKLGLSTTILFVVWFVFVLVALVVSARRAADRFDDENFGRTNPLSLFRAVATASAMSSVVAVTAWFALIVNDEIFYSRLLPWIGPLIRLQEPGFRVASRMLPEPHKWLSAFLLSNVLAYFPILLTGVLIYARSSRVRLASAEIFRSFIPWGAAVGAAGLVLRISLYRFLPELSSPLRAWDVGRLGWTVLDSVTGILALVLTLLVPFCGYIAVRAIWNRKDVLPSLVDLTWLASFGVVALTLAYQFHA